MRNKKFESTLLGLKRGLNEDTPAFVPQDGWQTAMVKLLSSPGGKFAQLSSLAGGTPIDRLLAEHGVPDDVSITIISNHKPFVGSIRHPFLTLTYSGEGRAILDWMDSGWALHKVEASHQIGMSVKDVAKNIQSSDAVYLRSLAIQMYRRGENNRGVLSLVADRVLHEKNAEDRHLIDALAWFCKLLGRTGDPKYLDGLVEVAKFAQSSKLRRYAKNAAKQIQE